MSYRKIAAELNNRNIKPRNDDKWNAMTIYNVFNRRNIYNSNVITLSMLLSDDFVICYPLYKKNFNNLDYQLLF